MAAQLTQTKREKSVKFDARVSLLKLVSAVFNAYLLFN